MLNSIKPNIIEKLKKGGGFYVNFKTHTHTYTPMCKLLNEPFLEMHCCLQEDVSMRHSWCTYNPYASVPFIALPVMANFAIFVLIYQHALLNLPLCAPKKKGTINNIHKDWCLFLHPGIRFYFKRFYGFYTKNKPLRNMQMMSGRRKVMFCGGGRRGLASFPRGVKMADRKRSR